MLGQVVFGFDLSIAQILISVGTCAIIEFVHVFRSERVIAWPASAMLTGNGIALILRVPGTEHGDWWSLRGWWVFAGTAAFGMASKYVVRHRGRHVFNPSNVALVVAFVVLGEQRADPQILWWGPLNLGLVLAFVVILSGSIAITRRVRQGHTAISFWLVFAASVAVIAASGHTISANWHVGPVGGWDYWVLLVTSPEVLVFLFFMITDPKTSPRGRVGQSVFGALIALSAALIVASVGGEFGTKVGILAGLVIACPFVPLIEARSPVPRSDDDQLIAWLSTATSANRGRRNVRWGRIVTALLACTCFGVVLAGIGARTTNEAEASANLARRAEVPLDPAAVPEVAIDPAASSAALSMTEELARHLGRDLVHGLLIERVAIERGDVGLAEAALGGVRLEQARAIIAGAPNGSTPTRVHSFESLTATVFRPDPGPQTPPELAIVGRGTVSGPDGSESFEHTFTLSVAGDAYVIMNEYDSEGRPVGAQNFGPSSSFEAAMEVELPKPTTSQLAGLRFTDVTVEVGLSVDHSPRHLREGPLAMTGGVAVGDFDADGDVDLFVTRVEASNSLYRNDDGTFVDVTEVVGLDSSADQASTGAMWVDVDGDTHLDLVVLGLGSTSHRLYLARGDGTFRDASKEWGISGTPLGDPDAASFSLAAADYDRDGRVDLLIVESSPHHLESALRSAGSIDEPCTSRARAAIDALTPRPSGTRLLRNTGSSFEDRTARLGIEPSNVAAMTPRFADIDGDGWDDLLIAATHCTTRVLLNDRAGGFRDVTSTSGIGDIEHAVGAEVFDADADGTLDWFLTGVSYPTASGECPLVDVPVGCDGNRLLLGNGDGTFTDATDRKGVRHGFWGSGAVAADLNLDGRVDLLAATGFRGVGAELSTTALVDQPLFERSAETPSRLWLNVRRGPWPEASEVTGLTSTENAKASVPLDYDGDGRMDLLLVNTDGPPTLYRNETATKTGTERHWLNVRLLDPTTSNTSGIGATVEVQLLNDVVLRRRISADGSFQSGRQPEAHFGLGALPAVKSVEVVWPDGRAQRVEALDVDRVLTIRRS